MLTSSNRSSSSLHWDELPEAENMPVQKKDCGRKTQPQKDTRISQSESISSSDVNFDSTERTAAETRGHFAVTEMRPGRNLSVLIAACLYLIAPARFAAIS